MTENFGKQLKLFSNINVTVARKYFTISQVNYEGVLKENDQVDASKVNKENDIPTNVIWKNTCIFAYFKRCQNGS